MNSSDQTSLDMSNVESLALDIKDTVTTPSGDTFLVSTVQLIYFNNGLPYETMIFATPDRSDPGTATAYEQRYRTPGGARQGHAHVVDMLAKGNLDPDALF